MNDTGKPLCWLVPGQAFPPTWQTWGADAPVPGLLCAGGDLSVDTLHRAYRHGIFPWFSQDQPILWWSPDPRMVLSVDDFRLHPSLRKTLKKFILAPRCDIRIDSAFDAVIQACSASRRHGQTGTWIVPPMAEAYQAFHTAGFAHSIETWVDDELVGGLYCVAIGRAVFGESMFHRHTDASKIALAALVGLCRHFQIRQIDCQQNTRHLASLGAREIARASFTESLKQSTLEPAARWLFEPVYWTHVLAHSC